jgi:hypothetical protein
VSPSIYCHGLVVLCEYTAPFGHVETSVRFTPVHR